MAAVLTVVAIVGGIVLGLANGGSPQNLRRFHPELWQVGVGGLAVELVLRVGGWSGGVAVLADLLATGALLAFAVANVRIGGMVLVVAGLAMNLVPLTLNWGTPTSAAALERAGVVEKGAGTSARLEGPRHVADGDDWFRWLGEVVALPTGQVISLGDGVQLIGYLLVTASVLRGRRVRRTDGSYRARIAPLGAGPARRRGPGLHPSRLEGTVTRRRAPASRDLDDASDLDDD